MSSLANSTNVMNSAAARFNDWCSCNKLTINLNKSKVMLLANNSRSLRNLSGKICIKIKDHRFDVVNTYKYLGLVIDETLSFDNHIEYICGIIKGKIYLLNKIRKYINVKTALLLYKSSILSYFDIGDMFYNSAKKSLLAKLQIYQNKALRCIYYEDKGLSTRDLHVKAGLSMLQDRRDANLAAFAHARKLDCYNFVGSRGRALRSNFENILETPRAKNVKFENSFVYASIKLWNTAGKDLRNISQVEYKLFKMRYKAEMWQNFINFPV